MITVSDVPIESHLMKRLISQAFDKERKAGTLMLKANKSKALLKAAEDSIHFFGD